MKILITGANGQLGYHLAQELSKHQLFSYGRKDLDITDVGRVFQVLKDTRPDAVIHAAAFTNVDGCEQDEEQAYLVNTLGARYVALACREVGARMAYISTDFVFDGRKRTPYQSSDLPNPLSVYGQTKLGGEQEVSRILAEHYVVRTSWLFGDRGHNFVRTILRLADERDRLAVVDDQIGSPTYAKDLAEVVAQLVSTPYYGLYQVSNRGTLSWYEFARNILRLAGKDVPVEPISSDQLDQPATRPAYSVLSPSAIEHTLGISLRSYQDALQEFLARLSRHD